MRLSAWNHWSLHTARLVPALTCNSPGRSCHAPSCLPDVLVWPPTGDSPSPVPGSAGQCQPLHTLRRGALWSGMRTTTQTSKQWSYLKRTSRSRLPRVRKLLDVPSWLHRRSVEQVLWLEPGPRRWDTAYGGHIFHSPNKSNAVRICAVTEPYQKSFASHKGLSKNKNYVLVAKKIRSEVH